MIEFTEENGAQLPHLFRIQFYVQSSYLILFQERFHAIIRVQLNIFGI